MYSATCDDSYCGLGVAVVSLPLAATSVITAAIGVPLWVSGAQHVPVDQLDDNEAVWIPEVHVGAGSASVTMRF